MFSKFFRRADLVHLLLAVCTACLTGADLYGQVPAFPGAEGFGAVSVGGRGGDVYHVTSLSDTNTSGTLRYGVSTAPSSGRTIVFDISGNIHLASDLSVNRPNITIAGQTAPAQGITLTGDSVWLEDNDLVVRYIRARLTSTGGTQDAMSISNGSQIIMDHCSTSWSADETTSMTNNSTDNTIQWSLITEPLNSQNHARSSLFRPGANVASSPQTTFTLSVHHSLYAHGADRNPVLSTYNDHILDCDFRNNVVFDWKNQATHTGDEGSHINVNFVSNYYVAGLTTRADLVADPTIFSSGHEDTVIYYNEDNLVDATRDDGLHNGIWDPSAIGGARTEVSTPFSYPAVTTQSANDAYESVLNYAGSFWWNRDPVDDRVTTDVREISDPDPAVRAQSGEMLTTEADAGGLPTLPIETRAAGWDTDQDGMPNWWEEKHGLNPSVANNNGDFDNDLYTDVEEYINEVGAFPSPAPIVFGGSLNPRFARSENWSAQWQPSRYDTAVLPSGAVVVDAVGQHAGTIRVAPESGQVAALDISSGWLEVADSVEIAAAGADGQVNLSGGKLRVGTLTKGVGGSFNFTGGTLAADVVEFDLINNGGAISPGDSVGQTQIMGDLTVTTGVLEIEIGGTTGGSEFDRMLVAGDVTLAGTLDVSLLSPFTLSPGMSFEILDVDGTLTGTFSGLAEGDLVGNLGEDVFITYAGGDGNDVALFTKPDGDFDGDGDVDVADLMVWQRTDGSSAGLAAWRAEFGESTSQHSGVEPVPEPATALLLLLAAVLHGPLSRRM